MSRGVGSAAPAAPRTATEVRPRCTPERRVRRRRLRRISGRRTVGQGTLARMSERAAVVELGRRARAASRRLATASTADKDAALLAAADLLLERAPEIARRQRAPTSTRRQAGGMEPPPARPAAPRPTPASRPWPPASARSPRCPTRRRGARRLAPPERARHPAGPGPARRGRDHLREPPERHQRRRRALPEVGQRRAPPRARRPRCAPTWRSPACSARRAEKAGLPEDARDPRRRRRRTRRRSR